MTGLDVLDLSREAIWVALKIGMPLMLIALCVGITISLIQALTQIQDMSVSFVPKMIAIFFGFLVMLPFMSHTLSDFSATIFTRIKDMGKEPHR